MSILKNFHRVPDTRPGSQVSSTESFQILARPFFCVVSMNLVVSALWCLIVNEDNRVFFLSLSLCIMFGSFDSNPSYYHKCHKINRLSRRTFFIDVKRLYKYTVRYTSFSRGTLVFHDIGVGLNFLVGLKLYDLSVLTMNQHCRLLIGRNFYLTFNAIRVVFV